MDLTIIIVGVVAALFILVLIAVNVILVRWICKRNKEKSMQGTRMSVFSQQSTANLVRTTRRTTANSEVKYVTTEKMTNGMATKKGRKVKKKSYENTDDDVFGRCGDIPSLPTEYTFDNLQRNHRPKEDTQDDSVNEYGHIHLGIDDGSKEYDSAMFVARKEVVSDSTYASVDKCKRGKIESIYNHTSHSNDLEKNDITPTELPERLYIRGECKDGGEMGYEVSRNVWYEKSSPTDGGQRQGNVSDERSNDEDGSEVTQCSKEKDKSKDIQTEYSCSTELQTCDKEQSPLLSRKSACTQVDDIDFALSVHSDPS